MFKRQTEEQLFFSTKVELKINNTIYRPSICYPVPALAKKSLEKYAADGKVVFYPNRVRFVNGALARTIPKQSSAGVPSIVREEEVKTTKRKSR